MKIVSYAGVELAEVSNPQYGYQVDARMPIITSRIKPFGYSFCDVDSTGSYDFRVLTGINLLLSASQKSTFNLLFNSLSGNIRCEKFILRLGNDPSGFFPFGPDYGDSGDFCVQLVSWAQGGMLFAPWKYFRDELAMVFCPDETWPKPEYELPAEVSQGSFEIGSVDGLLQPQRGFKPVSQYNYSKVGLTRSGVPSVVDGKQFYCDAWETSFEQWCNPSKAAALMDFLTGATGRASAMNLVAGTNYYPYGIDKGSSGTFSSNLLGSENTGHEIVVSCKHVGVTRFSFPLNFSKAA